MPLKHFGIFLAYGPTVDLRKEGLGRLLAAFLKAAATIEGIRFVIACPLWFEANLRAFCDSEEIPFTSFDIVTTDGMPFILRLYLRFLARGSVQPSESMLGRIRARIQRAGARHRRYLELRLVAARSFIPWTLISLYLILLVVVLLPIASLGILVLATFGASRWIWTKVYNAIPKSGARLLDLVYDAAEESVDLRLYRVMEELETRRMRKIIDTLHYVKAWFCPTSFWPEFNKIAMPTLLCVPDVLLAEFSTGFAAPAELLKNFEDVERTIRGGRSFVTYSSGVKWNTLVNGYSVDPEDVAVIPHACSDLSPWVMVKGFSDNAEATANYCRALLQQALGRLGRNSYVQGLQSGSLKFIFYASQFRPNKNVITLLRAYNLLLRERFVQHKLILTGDPNRYKPVLDFVQEHGLTKDVVFLHGLTTSELAACYYLADIAVNPSLSEGGCPFTFTEAVSVNTPVVMARIAVTEEVVKEADLQEMMLFDPYDYKDAAFRIEWGLQNRDRLLSRQLEACEDLRQRTWRHVVEEHIAILDRLGNESPSDQKRSQ